VLAAENKEGFPPPLNCQRDVVFLFLEVFTVIHAFHFMACQLLSAPPCLALVPYTLPSLLRLLRSGSCVVGTRHSFARISLAFFAIASFSMSTSCSRFRWSSRRIVVKDRDGFLFSDSDDNFMIP